MRPTSQIILSFFTCLFLFVAQNSIAARYISVTNAKHCNLLQGSHEPFILIINKDNDIMQQIIACAKAAHLPGASLTGLGSVKNPTLAYYHLNAKKFRKHKFEGLFELAALNGDIARLNNKLITHIHVVLGDNHYRGIAGHLINAKAGISAEITITPFREAPIRKHDKVTGLDLMVPTSG